MNSRGGGRPKIRPPRKGILTPSSDVDFEDTWKQVSQCLTQMHTKDASSLSFEVVYRFAYKIVLKKMGERFYQRFTQFERNWLGDTIRPNLEKLCPDELILSTDLDSTAHRRDTGNRLLKAIADAFSDHQSVMNMTTDVFMYLDRVFCNDHRFPPIYTLAMLLFKDEVLRAQLRYGQGPVLQDVVVNVILNQIALEREGDIVDNAQIKACVFMLEGLHETEEEREDQRLYRTVFEPRYLESSRAFYRAEARSLMRQKSTPDYCNKVIQRIREEEERCRFTLSESSTPAIVAIVEEELIRDHIAELINADSGSNLMVAQDRYDELANLYNLNSRVDPKKDALCTAISRQILTIGSTLNATAFNATAAGDEGAKPTNPDAQVDPTQAKAKDAKKSPAEQIAAALQWVESILALHDKFDRIWKQSFESDNRVQPTIAGSINEFMNNFKRAAEYVSLYIDDNLKHSLKDKTEQQIDATLENAIMLVQFLNDKDLFEAYYKKHLGRRLSMKKTIGMDQEKQMAERMQARLGKAFTSKIERMFGDMAISDDLTKEYKAHVAHSAEKRATLGIQVLAHHIWPVELITSGTTDRGDTDEKLQCIYPPEIERIKQSFEQFYNINRNGRKLEWCPNLGSAELRGIFPKVPGKTGGLEKERRYEITVTTYAMIILLQFNDLQEGQSLSFDEIQTRTNIPTEALRRNLLSLSLSKKTQLLTRIGQRSSKVGSGDRFRFNDQFVSVLKRFKISAVAATTVNKPETEKELVKTEEKSNELRHIAVDAAIVRLMKQRKLLNHAQLVAEVIAQVAHAFKPAVPMIKERIDGLLEREYIERTDDIHYQYIA